MANTYTWEDFQRALEQSGLGNQFSQADLNSARQNPDFGMSMLAYKTDYANATTPEAKALANQGAENLRSSLFGYTGGGDGGSFRLDPMSPRGFSYGDAPIFDDKWEGRISDALEASMNRDPYSYAGAAPTYDSRYDPQIQETIAGILGRGEFSYDPKTDPVYSAYQKQYAREGQRATANAMGEAAAMTGGMPSSWAMTAASQAGDYYGAQMADKIPELYQDAYNRYLQEYQMKLSDLNALRGLESDDYRKYQDQLSQYNKDRDFDYATWLDNIELGQRDLENLRALRSDDLALYQTNLGQYNTDRSFDYGQWLDEIQNQRTAREDQRSWAQNAAAFGDYSLMDALGISTDTAQRRDAIAEALQAAEVGDYSALAALGFDVSNAQQLQQLEQAYKQAQIDNLRKSGSSAGSGSSGTGIPSATTLASLANTALKAGDMDSYNQIMSMLGLSADMEAVQEKQVVDTAKQEAKKKISDDADPSSSLSDRLDWIRTQKAAGNPSLQTEAQVRMAIKQIPGYSAKTMGSTVDQFIAELFPKVGTTEEKKTQHTIRNRAGIGVN